MARNRTPDETAYAFEDEVFFRLRSQRNGWMWTAILSLLLAVASVGLLFAILPLKEKVPYLVMVDKTTGMAEKVARVEPVNLTEQEAVLQAELVRYVTDRETYDIADNQTRIREVQSHSRGQARSSLEALWTSSSPDYPPNRYADRARLTVQIVSLAKLSSNSAQVRFRKTLQQDGQRDVVRDFVATVGFVFDPRVERNLEAVWRNPLGFAVTNYRVDAETLSQRNSS